MNPMVCPGCGKRTASAREPAEYLYRECGLPGVRLYGGVTETTCPSCGERHVRIRKEGQLLQVIALNLLLRRAYLAGPEMRFLRRACGLTQAQLAQRLGKRRATIAEREARQDPNISLVEQLGLRLMFLTAFHEYLKQDGRNLLAESHREQLRDFTARLLDRVAETPPTGKRRLALKVLLEDDWQIRAAA